PSDNSGDPAFLTTQPAASYENKGYETWMRIANGLGNENGLLGSTHSENANALYFFENNQGDFKDQERYYKPQQWAQVGTNITQPGQPDYRDDVENGTYIEVEAYYVSDNEENPSRGPIRYRFMLGKDITYNYDAERNHHFKLTLGFNGWANQPDWHIEYEEPDPALVLPETFYVSYLYNQTHTLPIKLVGDCEELTMEIINNDWAPYINEETLAGTYSYTNPVNNPYAFRWANQIFSWQQQNQEKTNYPYGLYNATGFLALQTDMASDGLPPKNVVSNMKHGDRKNAVVELYDLYAGNKADPNTGNIVNQAFRHFSATDLDEGDHPAATNSWNDWNVKVIDDQTKVLHVPLWTRNKTMIYGTNYSGNNPFEAYQRIAKVKVTAKFKNGEEKVETLTVKQAQRIVNPKGVWRANHLEGDDKNFHVTLMVKAIPTDLQDAERANFTPLVSDGSWEAFIEQGETDF
ncbi:MAG: hypothetical protein K2J18_00720, partial [Paramuribaculum sp.]|nr:hypothetical protein [Paramuribaculum sp.]